MLTYSTRASRQKGMALLMAIIVLVALTLGALALTRTVYTSTVIAGNLAFQRSAMLSADMGIERAMRWLEDVRANESRALGEASVCGIALQCSLGNAGGYIAHRRADQSGITNGQTYWTQALDASARTAAERDNAGNRVRYVIQRMCMQDGDPGETTITQCVVSPNDNKNNNLGLSTAKLPPTVYYRITVMVDGARNTRHLAQAMISM